MEYSVGDLVRVMQEFFADDIGVIVGYAGYEQGCHWYKVADDKGTMAYYPTRHIIPMDPSQ